jgi:polyhydroxyalkanoate synthesis regulator phasin
MKRFIVLAFFALALTLGAFGPAKAGEVDVLINKLVEKGILSQSEAAALLQDMQKEGMRQQAEVKQVAAEAAKEETKKTSVKLPEWVDKIKLKGDLRLRYQGEKTDEKADSPQRDRYRIRWRVGAVAKVTDQWDTGFGFASGGDDPRSTNQTLENVFQTPDARLDYAYVTYKPFNFLSLTGGKFANPIWAPKDLLWDGDIMPDGLAAKLTHKISDSFKIFATPAFFILEEFSKTTKDPNLFVIQAGVEGSFGIPYFKVAGTYYDFRNLKGNVFPHSAGSNSLDSAGKLFYNYDSFAGDAEVGANLSGPVEKVALFAQYVQSDADDDLDKDGNKDNQGYLVGIKVGHKKISKLLDWELKYNYRELERDAWPDFLPDSDFYGGATDTKGHEFELTIGLAKNVTFGIDYYRAKPIRKHPEREQDLIQADLVVKW